jgi:hypothetical protein
MTRSICSFRVALDGWVGKPWRLAAIVLTATVLSLLMASNAPNAATLRERSVKLIVGGPAVRVTATGSDARSVVRFSIFRGTLPVNTVTALRRPNIGSNAIIELRAKSGATPSTDYRLVGRNAAGQRILFSRFVIVSKISTTLPRFGKGNTRAATKRARISKPVRRARAPLTARLSPAPVVSNWAPRDKAYPGMVLVVNGQNLNRGDVKLKLGSGSRAVVLRVFGRSTSRLDVRIPSTAVTGRRGAALTISRRGSQSRTLIRNFQVLNRAAIYSGDALYHAAISGPTSSLNDPVFTRGRVSVRLDLFEFGDSGSGTYSESTKLLKNVKSRMEKCGFTGQRKISVFDFRTKRASGRITWRRLADGRIELSNIGIPNFAFRSTTALGAANDRTLTLQYPVKLAGTRKQTVTGRCMKQKTSPALLTSGANQRSQVVEWVLARKDGL